MEKHAETAFPIHELLRQRWSPRAFRDQAVEPDKVTSLFEAAQWAASCFNEQPWSFIVATREKTSEFAPMLSCLREGNQAWAKRAPVLMLTLAHSTFTRTGQPNPHAWHDVGLAVGNLVVQATALGLSVHQMAGIFPDRIREVYRVPDGYEPVTGLAVGYRGDPASLSEDLRERELAKRTRKALHDCVFSGQWGRSAPFTHRLRELPSQPLTMSSAGR